MENIPSFGDTRKTDDAPPPYSVAMATSFPQPEPSNPKTGVHVPTNNVQSGSSSNFTAHASSASPNNTTDAMVRITNAADPLSSVLDNCDPFILQTNGKLGKKIWMFTLLCLSLFYFVVLNHEYPRVPTLFPQAVDNQLRLSSKISRVSWSCYC